MLFIYYILFIYSLYFLFTLFFGIYLLFLCELTGIDQILAYFVMTEIRGVVQRLPTALVHCVNLRSTPESKSKGKFVENK